MNIQINQDFCFPKMCQAYVSFVIMTNRRKIDKREGINKLVFKNLLNKKKRYIFFKIELKHKTFMSRYIHSKNFNFISQAANFHWMAKIIIRLSQKE